LALSAAAMCKIRLKFVNIKMLAMALRTGAFLRNTPFTCGCYVDGVWSLKVKR